MVRRIMAANNNNTDERWHMQMPDACVLLRLAQQLVRHPCLWDHTSALFQDKKARALAYDALCRATDAHSHQIHLRLVNLFKFYNSHMRQLKSSAQRPEGEAGVEPEWVRVLARRRMVKRGAAGGPRVCAAAVHAVRRDALAASRARKMDVVRFIVRRGNKRGNGFWNELALHLNCDVKYAQAMWYRSICHSWVCVERLAAHRDRPDAPPSALQLLLADAALFYEPRDLPTAYEEESAQQELYELVLRHGLERAQPPRRDPDGWAALLDEYTCTGRVSTAVLLQRRWYDVKRGARDALLAYKRARHERPTRVQVAVARAYPHVVTDASPPLWHELVADGRVALSGLMEEFLRKEHPSRIAADDVAVVEPSLVTIDLDDYPDSSAEEVVCVEPPLPITVISDSESDEGDQGEGRPSESPPVQAIVVSSSEEEEEEDAADGEDASDGDFDDHGHCIDPKLLMIPYVPLHRLGHAGAPLGAPLAGHAAPAATGAPCSEPVASLAIEGLVKREVKPVRLPRIEDVRRLNSCLLTAQVAPSPAARARPPRPATAKPKRSDASRPVAAWTKPRTLARQSVTHRELCALLATLADHTTSSASTEQPH